MVVETIRNCFGSILKAVLGKLRLMGGALLLRKSGQAPGGAAPLICLPSPARARALT